MKILSQYINIKINIWYQNLNGNNFQKKRRGRAITEALALTAALHMCVHTHIPAYTHTPRICMCERTHIGYMICQIIHQEMEIKGGFRQLRASHKKCISYLCHVPRTGTQGLFKTEWLPSPRNLALLRIQFHGLPRSEKRKSSKKRMRFHSEGTGRLAGLSVHRNRSPRESPKLLAQTGFLMP